MDMTITLPDDVAAKVGVRAASLGEPAPAYAARLVAQSVSKPTIDEIMEPVRADFAKSGMTDDELMEFGRQIVGEVRQNRTAARE